VAELVDAVDSNSTPSNRVLVRARSSAKKGGHQAPLLFGLAMKMEFGVDEKGQEILLKEGRYQVMMAWEKPYMEACIDALKPSGDVLEVGFGLGYSANRIQFYHPKTHTIIECDPVVIAKAKEWAKGRSGVTIIEKTWQEALPGLGQFDVIFFDDYPLEPSGKIENAAMEAAYAAPIVQAGKRLMQEQEQMLPQMKAQQYSDNDLQEFITMLPEQEKSHLPKFLIELYNQGQVKKDQLKTYLSKEQLASLEERTPSKESCRNDRLFDFLLPCLEKHMRKGARFSCYLESSISKYEDPLFQRYVIENPNVDYSETRISVEVPDHCRYFSGNDALVITITKQI
jgi:hypothetical protein